MTHEVTKELIDAQMHIDRALAKWSKKVGRGYVGDLRDYKRLVKLSVKLNDVLRQVQNGESRER